MRRRRVIVSPSEIVRSAVLDTLELLRGRARGDRAGNEKSQWNQGRSPHNPIHYYMPPPPPPPGLGGHAVSQSRDHRRRRRRRENSFTVQRKERKREREREREGREKSVGIGRSIVDFFRGVKGRGIVRPAVCLWFQFLPSRFTCLLCLMFFSTMSNRFVSVKERSEISGPLHLMELRRQEILTKENGLALKGLPPLPLLPLRLQL